MTDHYEARRIAEEINVSSMRLDGAYTWNSTIVARAYLALLDGRDALREDAERYRSIRDSGIPCLQGDECGSCTGEELDAQIDDAIAHPEKYEV